MSGTLDTARRILRGMGRREIQNKIAVACFAVVMVGVRASRGRRAAARRRARRSRAPPPSPQIIGVVIYYISKPKPSS